ncbi:MAG TPA: threonine synthase [Candidatus Omnitrophota bacterium]|nr:threonine synthase [Candidatus Omnitrophota bacterium]
MKEYAVKRTGIVERYQEYLPVTDKTPIISLNEGNTPLILAEALPKELGLKGVRIYYKFEGLNPTGSFKDRGMTMAISKAVEAGAKAVMCASTGNTSASAAAYACRCGLKCFVLIPEGKIAKGKLLQAFRYGAKTLMIKGNFDQALELVKEMTKDGKITLVNSINPYRIEGQKTASFEIVDDLGEAPEYHAIPVGNAGNITAYWKGYKEYQKAGKSEVLPKIEKTGLWVTDIEVLRLHYAETIAQWRARFAGNRDIIASLTDDRFCRMFEFYLAGAELSFRHMGHMVWQVQMTRRIDALPLTRDYMLEAERVATRAQP